MPAARRVGRCLAKFLRRVLVASATWSVFAAMFPAIRPGGRPWSVRCAVFIFGLFFHRNNQQSADPIEHAGGVVKDLWTTPGPTDPISRPRRRAR